MVDSVILCCVAFVLICCLFAAQVVIDQVRSDKVYCSMLICSDRDSYLVVECAAYEDK